MLIMYSAEALSRGAHFGEESSQVDAAVKAHSLAAVFAVCKTIVEFLEKELASDPSQLHTLGKSVNYLRSSPIVFTRRGIPLEKMGYRSKSVFGAAPVTTVGQPALGVSPVAVKRQKRPRIDNGSPALVKLESRTEYEPLIDQLRQKKIRDQDLRTMQIVQKINMNQGFDQRQRNISLNKSRKVLAAERKWFQQGEKSSFFQFRAKQTKSSLEDLVFLKRSNQVEFRVLETAVKVLGLQKPPPALEKQRLQGNRPCKRSSQQKSTKKEATLRQVCRDDENRQPIELKDTSLHVIVNNTSNKRGGNWINVSTYWKDHIDTIINVEKVRSSTRRQATSIMKDELVWGNTGPLASLMASPHSEQSPRKASPETAAVHVRPSKRSVLGPICGSREHPLKKEHSLLLKKVRLGKRANW